MGNVVAGEALRLAGVNQVVKTYVAMQGAISAHAYDPTTPNRKTLTLPDDYANYWTSGEPSYFNGSSGAGTYVNFFNPKDFALNANNWQFNQDSKPDVGYNYTSPNWYFVLAELSFPADRYRIFAHADPSWSYALGAQVGVGGVFSTSRQVELDLSPYNFDIEHKYHSGQFRSDSSQRWLFWNQVLTQMNLKK
jgi:hypothetical protein